MSTNYRAVPGKTVIVAKVVYSTPSSDGALRHTIVMVKGYRPATDTWHVRVARNATAHGEWPGEIDVDIRQGKDGEWYLYEPVAPETTSQETP